MITSRISDLFFLKADELFGMDIPSGFHPGWVIFLYSKLMAYFLLSVNKTGRPVISLPTVGRYSPYGVPLELSAYIII